MTEEDIFILFETSDNGETRLCFATKIEDSWILEKMCKSPFDIFIQGGTVWRRNIINIKLRTYKKEE